MRLAFFEGAHVEVGVEVDDCDGLSFVYAHEGGNIGVALIVGASYSH